MMADKNNCFVFLDNSNLWIAGQHLEVQLHDADTNPCFRVDLGKLLDAVTRRYGHREVFLYGSVSPANDSCWSAAWMEVEVSWYHPSYCSGEEEVDIAMACGIMEVLYSKADEKSTFLLVTGDCEFKPAVEHILRKAIAVELWSWEHSLSDEYAKLAEKNELLSVHKLNDIEQNFIYMSHRTWAGHKIDPACALVFKDLPRCKHLHDRVANAVARLLSPFYITCRDFPSKGTQDLIVEFPEMKIGAAKEKLRRVGLGKHSTYRDSALPVETPIGITHHFEALGVSDDSISPKAFEQSLSVVSGEVSDSLEGSEVEGVWGDAVVEAEEDSAHFSPCSWGAHLNARSKIRCRFGLQCRYGCKCVYQHTEHEKTVFLRSPNRNSQNWKPPLCRTPRATYF